MAGLAVRSIEEGDRTAWLRMRCALWPGEDADHAREVDGYWNGECRIADDVLVACIGGEVIGFLELRVRPMVDGSEQPVPYVEGWFVEAAHRGRDVGRALMEAAENWAQERGHDELASDSELDNASSQRAHTALGFEEVARVVLYLKRLG